MTLLPWKKKGKLLPEKLRLIDFAFRELGARSFADLGGVWGVEGGYTFYALDHHPVEKAALVDTHPTTSVIDRARRYPALRLLRGGFGDPSIIQQVGPTDAVFLFDVLLHQVAPDWDEIIERYAGQTKIFVIYNQQWTASDQTVRLLDLGPDEYFRNVPHDRSVAPYADLFSKLDDLHPEHQKRWRDVHNIWQWGITDRHLEQTLAKLGFRLALKERYGRFGRLKNFENVGFVFTR